MLIPFMAKESVETTTSEHVLHSLHSGAGGGGANRDMWAGEQRNCRLELVLQYAANLTSWTQYEVSC